MARYTGPKNRISRQIGEDLGLKSNPLKVARRLRIKPGQHGAKGHGKTSEYGIQLKEKQKTKYIYGILEKQLRQLFEEASKNPTATGSALLSLLERRLDNVVYRMGWSPTRAGARQLVSHGHITVNGKKVDVPSYRIQVDDVVALTTAGMKIPVVVQQLEADREVAAWLDRKKAVGKVARLPERDDIQEGIQEQLVVEYYSR